MKMFEATKINDNVTQVVTPGGVCVFLIEGEDAAVLIDTGYGLKGLKAYIDSLTDKPYTVIATHGHVDHIGGAGEFDQVYLSEKDWELAVQQGLIPVRMAMLQQVGMTDLTEDAFVPGATEYLPLIEEQSFGLGGLTVQMIPLAGHTAGSMTVLIKELRQMILGDACNSAAFLQLPESTTVTEYKESLENFVEKYNDTYDTVLFSHLHNFGDKAIVKEMLELCEDILEGKTDDLEMAILGEGIVVAKIMDETYRRIDGGTANVVYNKKRIS